jgi:hypothetical protein
LTQRSVHINSTTVHRSELFRKLVLFHILFILCSGIFFPCWGYELRSRYATIFYDDPDVLRRFNRELYIGGHLRSQLGCYKADTVEEEVSAKIDVITEKTMTVLDMYPQPLNYTIRILPNPRAVAGVFKDLYNTDVDYIAFYSPQLNRIFYSANNGRLRVICHEIGHVIVENYFKISPPQRIHEVMAQYVEKHIND